MRLEPVYLVAPKPKPPSMTRRRALGGMAACMFFGAACGYSVRAVTHGSGAREPDEDAGPPLLTGDPELDELRRLAVVAPVEELDGQFVPFFRLTTERYRGDRVLWRGVRQHAEYLLGDAAVTNRAFKARLVLRVLREDPPAFDLTDLIPRLDAVR